MPKPSDRGKFQKPQQKTNNKKPVPAKPAPAKQVKVAPKNNNNKSNKGSSARKGKNDDDEASFREIDSDYEDSSDDEGYTIVEETKKGKPSRFESSVISDDDSDDDDDEDDEFDLDIEPVDSDDDSDDDIEEVNIKQETIIEEPSKKRQKVDNDVPLKPTMGKVKNEDKLVSLKTEKNSGKSLKTEQQTIKQESNKTSKGAKTTKKEETSEDDDDQEETTKQEEEDDDGIEEYDWALNNDDEKAAKKAKEDISDARLEQYREHSKRSAELRRDMIAERKRLYKEKRTLKRRNANFTTKLAIKPNYQPFMDF